MRSASIEFHAIDERVSREHDKPLVEVLEAKLVGLSLVDSGAYPSNLIEAERGRVAEIGQEGEGRAAPAKPAHTAKFGKVWL